MHLRSRGGSDQHSHEEILPAVGNLLRAAQTRLRTSADGVTGRGGGGGGGERGGKHGGVTERNTGHGAALGAVP